MLDLTPFGPISPREEFLAARLAGAPEVTCLLTGERYLHLPEAHLTAFIVKGRIEISTDAFARQVTLEIENAAGTLFEDNFFDLGPGSKRSIAVLNRGGGNLLTVSALNAEPLRLRLDATPH